MPALTATPPPPPALTDAVNVPALRPNDTPLLFDQMTVPEVCVCVPAAIAPKLPVAVAPAATLAVSLVEPLNPNDTPFESLNTIVPELAVCVPAPMAPGAVDCV